MAQPQYAQFGDTTLTKVFVGGLAWETQRDTMRRYFEQFGDILEAVVITDKNTGRSKGYGFVTFRDPEAARRACMDPSPVIDGRRANCNIASLGRPRPSPPHGRMRLGSPYPGASQPGQAFAGGSNFPPSFPYTYPQGIAYPPYGYTTYVPDVGYHQNIYNPYLAPQYSHLYGAAGTLNPALYPYMGQPLQAGHGFSAPHGYGVQGPIVQFSGPGGSSMTTMPQHYGTVPVVQGPVPSAAPTPVSSHPQFVGSIQSQQKYIQGESGSEHPSG
ncbi:hypothetical protein SUGI_0517730 [Cryptomeria japonica]|uniref:uncharacterized protein LOC131067763 n=1 Tax=Cryptomeria japonica TaxID=3369 RepID=UPI002408DF13|nr:uncharacterized protein LOC131067763 [Cryptomeria japonica]GLJ26630.1 hypothetical protein SUGI_0517730 [Cryptomeria japonica]